MEVYNEDKTLKLENYDLKFGWLKESTITIHHDEVPYVERVSHYETIREYPNGGKDVKEVVDVEGTEHRDAYDEIKDIFIYIPYTKEELDENKKNEIRSRREYECFSIINRGAFWYEMLTVEQKSELRAWYFAWLDAPQTMVIPDKPTWLD